MIPEYSALVSAILVQIVSIAVTGRQMNLEFGARYNAGPRDEPQQMSARLGRLRRATDNGFEGLVMFAPAVLMVGLTGQSTILTAVAAWAYVAARLLYIPAYAFGWTPGRSIIWSAGFLATLVLLVSILL